MHIFKVGMKRKLRLSFFFSTVMYIRVKRHLKWEGGTWFRPFRIDWIVGSWGVTNKMKADLKCQFADSGGGFLDTGFTADTQAWINVLFIRDDDHDQRHKTCLNSARAHERERERERERLYPKSPPIPSFTIPYISPLIQFTWRSEWKRVSEFGH